MSSDKSALTPEAQPMRTCYICNHTEFKKRKGMVRDDPSLQILECTNCSLVALSSTRHIQVEHYTDGQAPNISETTLGGRWYGLPSVESWLRETEQDDQRRFEMLKATLFD